jgi:hypothetical protein
MKNIIVTVKKASQMYSNLFLFSMKYTPYILTCFCDKMRVLEACQSGLTYLFAKEASE